MVSARDSRSGGLGSSPGRGNCFVFLGDKFSAEGNPVMDQHPIQWGRGGGG